MYTVGTSSLGALAAVAPGLVARPQRGAEILPATDDAGDLSRFTHELVERIVGVADGLGAYASEALAAEDVAGLHALGVEAESVARLRRGDNPQLRGLDDADQLWLLASDTHAGVAAACAAALLAGRTPRVAVPEARSPGDRQPQHGADGPVAEVLVLPKLATTQPGAIERAAGGLAAAFLLAARAPGGAAVDAVIAEFSGGYKVTVPLAVHLLEYLGSLHLLHRRFPEDVQLWFRHEYAASLFHRVSLRQLDAKTVASHSTDLEDVADGLQPATRAIEGFAYQAGDRGLVLTPVGEALLVLLRGAR